MPLIGSSWPGQSQEPGTHLHLLTKELGPKIFQPFSAAFRGMNYQKAKLQAETAPGILTQKADIPRGTLTESN